MLQGHEGYYGLDGKRPQDAHRFERLSDGDTGLRACRTFRDVVLSGYTWTISGRPLILGWCTLISAVLGKGQIPTTITMLLGRTFPIMTNSVLRSHEPKSVFTPASFFYSVFCHVQEPPPPKSLIQGRRWFIGTVV